MLVSVHVVVGTCPRHGAQRQCLRNGLKWSGCYVYRILHTHTHVHTLPVLLSQLMCTQRCNHAHTCMQTKALLCPRVYLQSCPHIYAHIGAAMPARKCAHMRYGACTYVHSNARSCLHVYAHIGVIMPTHICTQLISSLQIKAYVGTMVRARLCMHRRYLSCKYMHAYARSCLHVYAQIGAINHT